LARRAQGAPDSAARELRAALADVERPGRSLALAERRSAFLADKWDVYAQLALTERARGRPGAAFEASERLRAREMLELLARGRVGAPSDTAAELVIREQDLRHRIAELTHDLESATAGDDALRGPNATPLRTAATEGLTRAQEAYAELLLEMRERTPQHAALVSPETPTWRDVARRLAPDEAFIEYLVSDSGTLAFAPRPDALPASRREVAAIARLAGPEPLVLSGGAATEDAFRREAPTRRILHLATYGVLNKHNPLFSYVDLAPGGGQDGRLEVHEVFGLRLQADLVVLSACQTGLGSGALADVPTGDDWVGLAR